MKRKGAFAGVQGRPRSTGDQDRFVLFIPHWCHYSTTYREYQKWCAQSSTPSMISSTILYSSLGAGSRCALRMIIIPAHTERRIPVNRKTHFASHSPKKSLAPTCAVSLFHNTVVVPPEAVSLCFSVLPSFCTAVFLSDKGTA